MWTAASIREYLRLPLFAEVEAQAWFWIHGHDPNDPVIRSQSAVRRAPLFRLCVASFWTSQRQIMCWKSLPEP